MTDSSIKSISSDTNNVRQDVYPFGQWTITTRKGIILQSHCTCNNLNNANHRARSPETNIIELTKEKQPETRRDTDSSLCHICWYHKSLPQLNNMPDMLFKDNLLKLEHYTGVGIEFNPLDALRLVKETKDPLRVAVAGGWQSARSDFPFAKSIVKPYDWTLTTDYRGSLLSAINRKKTQNLSQNQSAEVGNTIDTQQATINHGEEASCGSGSSSKAQEVTSCDRLSFEIEETDERIDVNKLRVREEILFYDDITLYEDELADHGTAQYSVKVRVMPKSLFILARYYLRIDGVLARINDTRIYYELNKRYLLREYTNREAKLSSLPNLPVSTLVNPNELMNHLPVIASSYERLNLPKMPR